MPVHRPRQPRRPEPGTNNQQNQGPRIYRETGNVVRVIDGDTLKVDSAPAAQCLCGCSASTPRARPLRRRRGN